MKIYCRISGREGKPIQGRNDHVPVYKCYPPGGKKNLDSNAKKFSKIEDAAHYLRTISGAGIRVAAIGIGTGQKTAILNSNLVIEHNDGRKELL